MNILLTGATGFIGRNVLLALEKAGHRVTACVRNPDKIKQLSPLTETIEVDFISATDITDWLPLLKGIDVVINAVGIINESGKQTFSALHTDAPAALFSAAEQAGVKRVIQISALGADEQAESQYHLSKLAADDLLASLALEWFILRPSVVYGEGAASMALFRAMAALPFIPVLDHGRQFLQPVHVSDLVAAVMRCLNARENTGQTIDVVGPEKISYLSMLKMLRNWLGRSGDIVISAPASLIIKLVPLMKWMDEPALSKDSLQMLQRSSTSNPEPITKLIGHPPISLDQVLKEQPATQAERWHARLYFLRPLLRLSIAFVWIFTGIVSAFFYPHENSFVLLEKIGLSGIALPLTLYGAALLDFLLGVATLFLYRLKLVVSLQLALIIFYSLLLTAIAPEYWLHPFGPLVKNIPLIVATIIMLILEVEKR